MPWEQLDFWYKNYSNHFLEHIVFLKKFNIGNPMKGMICSTFIIKYAV